MNLKKIVAVAATSLMVGFAGLGLGAGVADAKPHGPKIPGIPGPGKGHWGPDWDVGGRNWGGGVDWVDVNLGNWIPPWWYFIPPPPPPPPPCYPGYPCPPPYPGY